MKYIHATKGTLIALVIFVFAAWLIPSFGRSGDVEVILTISTFLFAIIAGFFLSRLNNRYNKVRELVAVEDANWLSLYESSIFFGAFFQKRIAEVIDKYYIIAYDHDIGNYYKQTAPYLHQAYKELEQVNDPENVKQAETFGGLVALLDEIEEYRNESSVLAADGLSLGTWIILYVLMGIILFCIFFIRSGAFYSNVITVLLAAVLVLVLLVMRDLQNFRLGGKYMVDESGQEVFEAIGKPRYYHKWYFNQTSFHVPSHVKEYRLGIHKPGEEPNIKLVRVNNG